MNSAPAMESALLILLPAAEAVVGQHRARYDAAAQVGVPAHITVNYPFRLVEDMTGEDHRVLSALVGRDHAFDVVLSTIDWFDEDAVFLAPDDPQPIVALTRAVERAFPQFPLYGGVFDEVIPHVTIGHGHDAASLKEAERHVLPHLPVVQRIDDVQLWAGPALESQSGTWQRIASYPLTATPNG